MIVTTEISRIEITYEEGDREEALRKKEEYEECGFELESDEDFDGGTGLIVLVKIY